MIFAGNDKAVSLCKEFGSSISSLQLFQEAKNLGQKSCVCGWLDGEKVDSLKARSEFPGKSLVKKLGHDMSIARQRLPHKYNVAMFI